MDKIELQSLIKAEHKKAEQKAKEEAEATEESEEDREGSEGEDAVDSDYTFLDKPEEDEAGVNNLSRTLSCHTICDWSSAEFFFLNLL